MLKSTESKTLVASISLIFVSSIILAYVLFAPGYSPDGLDLSPGLKATETLLTTTVKCLKFIGSGLTLIGVVVFKAKNNASILKIGIQICVAGIVLALMFKIIINLPIPISELLLPCLAIVCGLLAVWSQTNQSRL